jgi:hypothetical protein
MARKHSEQSYLPASQRKRRSAEAQMKSGEHPVIEWNAA